MWYARTAKLSYEELDGMPEVELSPLETALRELMKGRRWRVRPYRRTSDYDWDRRPKYTLDISPHPVPGMIDVPAGHPEYYPGYWSNYYRPELAEHERERSGGLTFDRFHLKPESGLTTNTGEEENGQFIYRGLHADELDSILRTGKIESDGSYNLAGQEAVTCFSLDPRQAEHYATGFAPFHAKPSFTHPAYVIKMRMPPSEKIRKINAPEVEVYSPIDASQIVDIYRAKPYAIKGGFTDINPPNGTMNYYYSGSGSHPTSRVGWERAEDKISPLQ